MGNDTSLFIMINDILYWDIISKDATGMHQPHEENTALLMNCIDYRFPCLYMLPCPNSRNIRVPTYESIQLNSNRTKYE